MSSHHVPIVIVSGKAGSGKDTVGTFIKECWSGVCVAQADPMKRFTSHVFGFSEEVLWGPSENRNVMVQETVTDKESIRGRFDCYMDENMDHELFSLVVPLRQNVSASERLTEWFYGIYQNSLCNDIPVSPRFVLQTLGTEWGRHVSPDMWSKYAIETCRKLVCGGYAYNHVRGLGTSTGSWGFNFGVITDGRFRNEALNVRMVGGVALRVDRPDQEANAEAVSAAGVKGHVSERLDAIPDHFYNQVVKNDGDLADLSEKIDGIMKYYYGV